MKDTRGIKTNSFVIYQKWQAAWKSFNGMIELTLLLLAICLVERNILSK